MTTIPSVSIHVIAAIVVGIVLDWAIVERLKIIAGAFGNHDEVHYRDLPLWRLLVIAVGAAVIGAGLTTSHPVGELFWAGLTIFTAANIYGDIVALRR